jgi:copper homeostasis protein
VLDHTNRVDVAQTRSLTDIAGGERVTFHRAFDRTPDIFAAADALISIGISRVLTSGGASNAQEGAEVLAALVAHCAGRLEILAGGGVRAHNVCDIVRLGNVREVHARCECDAGRIRAITAAVSA